MTKREHEIITAVRAATDGLQDPLEIVQAARVALREMGCGAWSSTIAVSGYRLRAWHCTLWIGYPYVHFAWADGRDGPTITTEDDDDQKRA